MQERTFSFWVGVAIVGFFLLMALIGPWIAPYTETDAAGGIWETFSWQHLLGTDNLGRDVLSRLLYGTRATIMIAMAATGLSFATGMVFGFLAAVVGGFVDQVISRVVDVFMSVPTLIFALVALSLLPSSIPILILVMATLDSTRVFRLARAIARDVVVLRGYEVRAWPGSCVAKCCQIHCHH